MNTGTCPKCSSIITKVHVEYMSVHEGFTPAWKGVSFVCPLCHAILGVGIDPVALKAETVQDIVGALLKKKGLSGF